MNTKKFRNICFTSFDDEIVMSDKIQYMIYGREICPETGRHHLQGYIEFKGQERFTSIKKLLGNAHIEPRRGNQRQAIDYCKKDGQFVEFGELKIQGKRSDLEDINEMINSGADLKRIRNEHPASFIRYQNSIRTIYNEVRFEAAREECKNSMGELYDWQEQIVRTRDSLDRRKVLWVYDNIGGKGKSFTAEWLMLNRSAVVFGDMNFQNCAFTYNGEEYVIFDVPRAREVVYGTIESFTNRIIHSTKYQPVHKICTSKVLVFSNFPPDRCRLSLDRWEVIELPQM